jgi:hypothetical protein
MKRLAVLLGVLALTGCGDDGKITEIARYPSPAGDYDAVVGHMTAGQSQPHLVVITKPGDNPLKGERLMMIDKGDTPVVEWSDGRHMTIRCDGGRIWSYRNFYVVPTMRQDVISVALACAPRGWAP